ncbi:MAG: antibiotic biosynthesis monooxygenase [Phycisphaerales bacterium]|nr:antibiotic biosynthesis monooxygenase [Phycisphaerales bacterium]
MPARTSLHRVSALALLASAAGLALLGAGQAASTQEGRPVQEGRPAQDQDQPEDRPVPAVNMGDMLAGAIRSVPGCYGVELAQTQSGKSVIMAWFEDKAAVMRWYNHPVHRGVMGRAAGEGERTPLEHVPDDATNLMVVATITMSDAEHIPGFPMPISQISIETYQSMPTGISLNGRLSPSSMKIPNLEDHTVELVAPGR